MALRKVVRIDQEKCDGCGECVTSCAEGAIAVIDGKARLVSETYCDGLGACLGRCPQDAITVEERETAGFDEAETQKHLARLSGQAARAVASELINWPVQLTLVPPGAPYLRGADILLVADCVPFALPDFHQRFLHGKPVVIGCPKLDQPESYITKLADVVRAARPKSLTVIHMEVPCCSGLTRIAEHALAEAESGIPLTDITIGIRGDVLAVVEQSPQAQLA